MRNVRFGWKAAIGIRNLSVLGLLTRRHQAGQDLTKHLLTSLAASVCLTSCNPVISDATAIFQDVQSPSRWAKKGEIIRHYPDFASVPRYIVENGKLYLLMQTTRNRALVVEVATPPKWDAPEISSLLTSHPELRGQLAKGKWVNLPR